MVRERGTLARSVVPAELVPLAEFEVLASIAKLGVAASIAHLEPTLAGR